MYRVKHHNGWTSEPEPWNAALVLVQLLNELAGPGHRLERVA